MMEAQRTTHSTLSAGALTASMRLSSSRAMWRTTSLSQRPGLMSRWFGVTKVARARHRRWRCLSLWSSRQASKAQAPSFVMTYFSRADRAEATPAWPRDRQEGWSSRWASAASKNLEQRPGSSARALRLFELASALRARDASSRSRASSRTRTTNARTWDTSSADCGSISRARNSLYDMGDPSFSSSCVRAAASSSLFGD
mmetsp:Transcript_13533/g.44099  ORF Transcript_13533/g.44099 Transcript_13533/m.44099 type:complete len:200 (+) Transcript_13533:220-819(+)